MTAITALVIGLSLFFGAHLLPTLFRGVRQHCIERVGMGRYKGIYTVVALLGFGLIIWGKGSADYIHLYQPPVWGRTVAQIAMLPILILLAAAYLPTHLRRLTSNPMLLATFLWAVVHLLANGDLASVLLFGGFAVWSKFSVIAVTRRDRAALLANGGTGADQSADKPDGKLVGDIAAVAVGLATYALIVTFHAALFGMPAMP